MVAATSNLEGTEAVSDSAVAPFSASLGLENLGEESRRLESGDETGIRDECSDRLDFTCTNRFFWSVSNAV